MSGITRRRLLGSAAAVGLLGGACGVGLARDGFTPFAEAVLTESFGGEIAGHAETARFLRDFRRGLVAGSGEAQALARRMFFGLGLDALPGTDAIAGPFREALVTMFLQSTNVIRHVEGGENLSYTGLFTPYGSPCGNMLSAQMA